MPFRLKNRDPDPPLNFVPRKLRKVAIAVDSELKNSVPPSIPPLPLKDPLKAPDKAPSPIDPSSPTNSPPKKTVKSIKWTEKTELEMSERDWRAMCSDLRVKCTQPLRPLLSWTQLDLPRQCLDLLAAKFPNPTPVQRTATKVACDGQNMVAIAPTGSGKTIAFLLPILHLQIQNSLVLAPTRELALQIGMQATLFKLPVAVLVGGHDIAEQQAQIAKSKVIVATPGRLLDILGSNKHLLAEFRFLVIDEADRMLDLGFEDQLRSVLAHLPAKKQTLLFSATWSSTTQEFSENFVASPVKIEIEVQQQKISQELVLVNSELERQNTLVKLLNKHNKAIVFVATKISVDELVSKLGDSARALHGGMSQTSREAALHSFASNRTKWLVATDVAARGVDVPNVSLVVNYTLPSSIDTYTHRIGRTGRAGNSGRAVSLVSKSDKPLFPELRKVLLASNCRIPDFLK